jgi:hypothetical protein
MTQYTLPTINNNAAGTIKCYLYVDVRMPLITIPSKVKVLSISPSKEAVDLNPGKIDTEYLTVELNEDYSVYSAGFWYNLFENYPTYDVQFMFILSESGTDSYFYRGSIFRENIVYHELYDDGSEDYIRTVSVQLVSMLNMLSYASTDSLIAELVTNLATYFVQGKYLGGSQYYFITPQNIIKAMMAIAFGITNSSCVVQNCDLQCQNYGTGAWENPITQNYILAGLYDPDFNVANALGFFEPVAGSNGYSWLKRYNNCSQVLAQLCLSLGVIPRYYYGASDGFYKGTSSDKHTIELTTRGNSYSGVLMTMPIAIQSDMVSNSRNKLLDLKADDVQTISVGSVVINPTRWYVSQKYGTGTEPQITDYSIQITQELHEANYSGEFQTLFSLWDDSGNRFDQVVAIKYWDYQAGATATITTGAGMYLDFIVKYLYARFTQGRREYTRLYGTIKANDGSVTTQQNLRVMVRTSINDGIAAKNFYATQVEKDILNNKATVTWVQE